MAEMQESPENGLSVKFYYDFMYKADAISLSLPFLTALVIFYGPYW
jgi:hypothetical protein